MERGHKAQSRNHEDASLTSKTSSLFWSFLIAASMAKWNAAMLFASRRIDFSIGSSLKGGIQKNIK